MSQARRLVVGPFNRVEGDLEVLLDIEGDSVAAARVNAPLYRGFERMLAGKDPRDALTLTPRICGICSISQSAAAARALAAAGGLAPAPAGETVAAIIHAVENLADHVTHFYLFFMPDFVRPVYAREDWHGAAVERFTPMEGSGQRALIEARADLLHILGLLAGKWPHTLAIQPGGVTTAPTARDRVRMAATLRAFRGFLERTLFGAPLEDFLAITDRAGLGRWSTGDAGLFLSIAAATGLESIGRGPDHYLSFGAYAANGGHAFAPGLLDAGRPRALDTGAIIEHTEHSWMNGPPLHPAQGRTEPDEAMADPAYSWCKAPRYAGRPAETGALARQAIDGWPLALELAAGGGSVFARVTCRLIEVARTQLILERLVASVRPEERFLARFDPPAEGAGEGLVEAARGALGHWVRIERGRIASYQIVAPTTWNFSPRDAAGIPGPVESALAGTPVRPGETTPVAVQHVVRSFDPCMVCTVH